MNDSLLNITETHRLLNRQLKKAFPEGKHSTSGVEKLIELVSNSYSYFDEERRLNRRAEEISNKELKEINSELESKNAFLDSFNYGLAHDVKNHTANLRGLLQMLFKYQKKGDTEVVTAITKKLELSVNQMSSILDGFLFLSAAEGSFEGDRSEINATELEEMVRLETNYLIEGRDLQMTFDFNIDGLSYSQHILRIILVNLISNSLKFARKEVKTVVHARMTKKEDRLLIDVVDNGIGMNLDDENSTMFKLFDKRRKNTEAKGFGIGLFMIKRILDSNKGDIEIVSKLREGTKVRIHLPIDL